MLREQTQNSAILAEYATQEIRTHREAYAPTNDTFESAVPTKRVAYLVDQLKRPEEVELLRILYRNLFNLVGVTSIYKKRVDSLKDEGLSPEEAEEITSIDKNENNKYGQKLEKTLHLSDFFIRNDKEYDAREISITRILKIIHGDLSVTPTRMEQGMYSAYSAGLDSACMSRQVGAAIANTQGYIIATGCNDVPKFGGGLYKYDYPHDHRCFNREDKICFNVAHKNKLKESIGEILEKHLDKKIETLSRQKILDDIYEKTRVKDLIEFSRAVHAEMDAITSLARNGGVSALGGTLYTTTFPCHSCARHIVATGINQVIYIEPYEKSLAQDLHDDSISFVFSNSQEEKNTEKVRFIHFEGVSPLRFASLFSFGERKDKSGKFISIASNDAVKKIPEYLDGYQEFELKAIQNLNLDIKKLDSSSDME